MSETPVSLIDQALMEVKDARQLDEIPVPEFPGEFDLGMVDGLLILLHARLIDKYPKAARDQVVRAIFRSLDEQIVPHVKDSDEH